MSNELTTRFPWEPAVQTTEETVKLLQRDFTYAVMFTAVIVHSEHDGLKMCVNTRRGQIVPRGECKFSDGTKFELQDIGMCQPGAPEMTVEDLLVELWARAHGLGLEMVI